MELRQVNFLCRNVRCDTYLLLSCLQISLLPFKRCLIPLMIKTFATDLRIFPFVSRHVKINLYLVMNEIPRITNEPFQAPLFHFLMLLMTMNSKERNNEWKIFFILALFRTIFFLWLQEKWLNQITVYSDTIHIIKVLQLLR